MIKIILFKFCLGLLIILNINDIIAQEGIQPPNVVFILADDIGPGDIGYYHRVRTGKEEVVSTPNIDALIKEGMRFSDAHSSTALCSPSRYSILTGNYSFRCYEPWGVWDPFVRSAIGAGEHTVANVAKEAGYKTGFFGKWHLGGDWLEKGIKKIYRRPRYTQDGQVDISVNVGGGPNEFGFDYSFCLPSGIQNVPYAMFENGEWYPLKKSSEIVNLGRNRLSYGSKRTGPGDSNWDSSKIGPILVEKAINFIKSSDEPFFVYYCSQAVHHPHTPPDTFLGEKLKGKYSSDYLAMVKELDLQVGAIVSALKEKGVYNNTLFIFTSDNGGMGAKEMLIDRHDPSNGFRDFKGNIYEGGHRVPFIASWPGKIQTNSESNELIVTHDLMATLYSLFGLNHPIDQAKDSKNLLPLFFSQQNASGHDFLIQQGGNDSQVAIRKGEWKLILKVDKNDSHVNYELTGLFNLVENPFEKEKFNLIKNKKYNDLKSQLLEKYIEVVNSKMRTTNI
ncbi:arylsulfatase [Seonamhaeicola sp. MEBiC1930]|uniref:sulfatase family protein n=1 Tax=Seonamhaeicola sp. MEBiC01930 TaxID=2976768 RepID=UPI0032527800